jgi:ADP-heptose:LPS heptosyltransferase
VREAGSVLRAMLHTSGFFEASTDFRMPVRADWAASADAFVEECGVDRPILFYRPLLERSEWSGCSARNPDFDAYAALFDSIRERFYVVSVADFVPDVEWPVGPHARVDRECHAGELPIETVIGLIARSAMVFASPGFATIVAQSVGTPSVCVFGGYEDGRSFSAGANWAPHLAIEPINPCACWTHGHPCDKRIDLAQAVDKLGAFANAAAAATR